MGLGAGCIGGHGIQPLDAFAHPVAESRIERGPDLAALHFLADIGRELHSQYMITYTPNNASEAGFHEIEVVVTGVSRAKARTRPGYWVAAKFQFTKLHVEGVE